MPHCNDKSLMCYPGQFCSCTCARCEVAPDEALRVARAAEEEERDYVTSAPSYAGQMPVRALDTFKVTPKDVRPLCDCGKDNGSGPALPHKTTCPYA